MKYPILFRIFAVLNILGFFVFGAAALVMSSRPADTGLVMVWIHWTVTIWLFVSAIAWFFANKASYHFLYSLSVILMIAGSYWFWLIWGSGEMGGINSTDRMFFTAIPALITFYTVFLVVAMFYTPVVAWAETRLSIKHIGISLGFFLVMGAALYGFGAINQNSTIIDGAVSYPDSKIDPQGTYSTIPGNASIRMTFYGSRKLNGLAIALKPDNITAESLHFAKLVFSDSAEFDPLKAPNMVIEFTKDDNQLVAKFPEIRARNLQVFPLSENKQTPSNKVEYFCEGFSAAMFLSAFEKYNYEENDYEYEDVEGDPNAYEQGNGQKITSATVDDFYHAFVMKSYFADFSEWDFDYSGITLDVDAEANKKIGMFKRDFAYLFSSFNDAVKQFQGFQNYDYERYLNELTGMELYLSKAKDYQNANNGTAFNELNPALITWAEGNLLPEPGHQIVGYTAQDYYDYCFQRMMRLAALSHRYLENSDYAGEADLYQQASMQEEFYGPSYLSDRFAGINLDGYDVESGWEQSSTFIGFWLRRKIDKTDEKCYQALQRIMRKYDIEWMTAFERGEIPFMGDPENSMEGDTTTYD